MIITILCLTILAHLITGKDVKPLVEKLKLKNVRWPWRASRSFKYIRHYARKVGRLTARPLLLAYYVLTDADTSTTEKAMIYGCLLYVVMPVSLIPRSVFKTLGLVDEGAAVMFVVKKIYDKITPEIEAKADATLDGWFKRDENVKD